MPVRLEYSYPLSMCRVATHLSIITACVPSIKPFLISLQSSPINSGVPRNYHASNSLTELRSWRSTLRTLTGPSRKLHLSLRCAGLAVTTYKEIEGSADIEHASTRRLTDGVTHQQREVDVTISDAPESKLGPRPSDVSLLAYRPSTTSQDT
ncbi:hypothetical protein F4778DRAFT_781785 [Xylariomycetidae sp. FL2044]|nr:hypothetical protein F4778DRAFT_781785 [Xylariomycetidae sp. FL2044]